MTLIKFRPQREAAREYPAALSSWDAFDRMVENAFNPGWPGVGRVLRNEAAVYTPPVDITHNGDEILVKAELPGVKPSDIELTIHGDTLTINGSKKMEQKEEDTEGKYRYIERRYGEFMRTFSLPTVVDEANAKAEFKDGVLEIHMPIAEQAKPRRIQIADSN